MNPCFKSIALGLLTTSLANAQSVIPLYAGKAPGSESWNWTQQESTKNRFNTRVIYNVVNPSLTAYLPDPAHATGTAVVICPGGGFHTLSIDSEGNQVARWLTAKGVAAFVLTYRLVRSLTDDPVAELIPKMSNIQQLDAENAPVVPLAIADGRQAMAYLKANAAQYGIHPDRIGILGFSAGGTVAAGVGFSYTKETRPAFIAPIYAYITPIENKTIPADAPPLFAAATTDDQLGFASQSTQLYDRWIEAKKPAELHIYAKGGHGFGMRQQQLPVDHWIDRFGEWLGYLGLLTKSQ